VADLHVDIVDMATNQEVPEDIGVQWKAVCNLAAQARAYIMLLVISVHDKPSFLNMGRY